MQTFPVSGTQTWTDAVPVCLSGANSVNEVEVLLVPHGTPRPGKEVSYSLLVKNAGTAIVSATAVLQYDMSKLDFVNSSFPSVQGTNTITFNFTDNVLTNGKTSVAVSEIQSVMYLLKVTADGKSTMKKWVQL